VRLALYEFGAGVAGYVSYVFAIYFVLGMAQAAQQRGDHSSTGLSQPMADMGLSRPGAGMAVDSGEGAPPPAVATPPGLAAPPAQPQAGPLVNILLPDLQLFLEADTLRHFDLIRAAAALEPLVAQAAVSLPGSMQDLVRLLRKQGYRLDARDPWTILGLSPLAGQEPTEMGIAARARTAALLLSLVEGTTWTPEDQEAARRARSIVATATEQCEAGLAEARRARRQLRPNKLPRWKELGADAVQAVLATPSAGNSTPITQWSQVLDPLGKHEETVQQHRWLADLLEKGDVRFLRETRGRQIVAWAPSEHNSLQRILAGFLRQEATTSPSAIIFLVPLPVFPGVQTVGQIMDLWSHPLLSEKYAASVKQISLLPQPVEYVLPGGHGPRHVRQGLACFRVDRTSTRSIPALVCPRAALSKVDGTAGLIVDLPSEQLPALLRGLSAPEFACLRVREPTRSVGSSAEFHRTTVRLLLPGGLSAMAVEILLRRLKREVLAPSMAIGNMDLYSAEDALIMECHSPSALHHANPLCSEAIFLSSDRVLVRTEASADHWVTLMDSLCKEGELTIISKLRWKASKFGGRPFAVPTASPAALAASRRRRGKQSLAPQQADFVTELRVNGEVGRQDRRIFDELILHVTQSVGIQMTPFNENSVQSAGTWKHLASHDPDAPPGRARLYLSNQEEVRRVRAALHGQVVQVGSDWLAVTVHNDLCDAAPLTGNGGRVL